MNSILLKNACLVTPYGKVKADLRYGDTILEIGENLPEKDSVTKDMTGKTILPGLVDVHVHLREPGYTHKETIAAGTAAAAHGGFTTIFAMPNVKPFPSTPAVMEDYRNRIAKEARIQVFPYATITKDEAGKELSPYDRLDAGYYSDDGCGVADGNLMKQALQQNARLNAAGMPVLFACHTEDMAYRKPGASVHDGAYKKEWTGIPSACETAQLERDLALLEETGGRYHACHISAKESVAALKRAKEAGLDVSGEVTAHHLLLEDKDVKGPDWKMNPPLRSHEDRMALINGLENGALDFIASDHAPHTRKEKEQDMALAPFGIVSLETSFVLLYTHFVAAGRWTLPELVHWMSTAPCARFGLQDRGRLEPGLRADLVIVDENRPDIIDPDQFLSKGRNTPFAGWQTACTICETICGGKTVWKGKQA